MRLVDFSAPQGMHGWYGVTDRLMGGLSLGQFEVSPAGFGVFSGEVSRANGGGFASVYLDFAPKDLHGFAGIELELAAPLRPYKVNLKDVGCQGSHVYQSALGRAVETFGSWQRFRLPFHGFVARRRGLGIMAPPLDLTAIISIGLVTAEGDEGKFQLIVKSINCYKA